MKLIKFGIILIFCIVNSPIFAKNTPSSSYISGQKNAEIQTILNQWRARSGIPSATLSILLPNLKQPITYTSGVTDYSHGTRIKSDTLFQAGSITKSFTSTIILQLESEGKLNIDDPITKYLPQYTQWRTVSIRQLLNHTSGIFNYTATAKFNKIRKMHPQAQFTPDEIIKLASEHRSYFPPGKGWKYSNTNYVLAGMIIQKVTGQSVETVINRYLHRGLKFKLLNTYYHARLYTLAFLSRMARGYSTEGRDVTTDNMSWANTAGAIITTSEDLLFWWRGLFQEKILPSQEMHKMMSLVCESTSTYCRPGKSMPHLSGSSIGKGYGLGIIQSSYGSSKIGPVWWHNGSTKGYKAIVMWYPKSDIYISLIINRDPGYLLKPNLPSIQRILQVLTS